MQSTFLFLHHLVRARLREWLHYLAPRGVWEDSLRTHSNQLRTSFQGWASLRTILPAGLVHTHLKAAPNTTTTRPCSGHHPGGISSQGWAVKGTNVQSGPTTRPAMQRASNVHFLIHSSQQLHELVITAVTQQRRKWAQKIQVICPESHSCYQAEPWGKANFLFFSNHRANSQAE